MSREGNPAGQAQRPAESWSNGESYEAYVGRWSARVARSFLEWLGVPDDEVWLDVGCGTGALTRSILSTRAPQSVVGIDRSADFVEFAERRVADPRATFVVGDAQRLPFTSGLFGAAVSGLVLNFVPDHAQMVREMARVVRPGGMVGVYVWDYADGMQMMRHCWEAAIEMDPAAVELDEGRRFLVTHPSALRELFEGAGMQSVVTEAIDIPTTFTDFEDYWRPFLGGQAPAPRYVQALDEEGRMRLRETLRQRLPIAADGSIPLTARAWAVAGTVPG